MKFTILLTLLTTLNVSATLYSQDTKLNISVKDKTIKEVIKIIEDQSNFRFFYSDDYLDLNKRVTLTAQNKNISEVLSDLLYEGTVTYKVLDNNVVVITPTSAQQVKISGKITDASTGEALPGVNVLIKGTTRGVTSDIDGNFTIEANNGDVLVFSYVGYLSEEVVFSGQSSINMSMSPDVQKLDEVVVVGYGTMKKKDLTGSVSSISSKEISENKAANVLQVMQGKVSGLDITQSSGQAGSGVSLMLRGARSIRAENSPLILVDGIEYGSTLDINPSDIESVDILKDAASTAIYGTRGANGVIIITTKKGGQGKTKVTFNAYNAWNSPTFIPDIMTGQEYAQKRIETVIADAERTKYNAQRATYNVTTGAVTWNQSSFPEPWTNFGYYKDVQSYIDSINLLRPVNNQITDKYQLVTSDSTVLSLLNNGTSLDYLSMIFKNSTTQNYELGVTGGNEKTALNLSIGLMEDRGLLRRDLMRRYNFKVGIDNQIFSFAKLGGSVLLTNKKFNKRSSGIFNQALKTGPIGSLYNDDGTYKEYSDTYFTTNQPNPMLDEVPDAYKNEIINNRIFGSTYLNLEFLKCITLRSSFGFDFNTERNGLYAGPKSLSRLAVGTASSTVTNYSGWSYTWDNTANFNKKFDAHSIQVLVGYSVNASQQEKFYINGVGQVTGKTEFYDEQGFSTVSTTTNSDNYFKAQQMISYFGRFNYSYMDKYLFQATYRNDGSSILAAGNKWHAFPSASFGWRMKEEEFLKNVDLINNLKLRLSWGIAGNAAVRPYQSLTLVSNFPIYYTFDDKIFSAYSPGAAGNKTLDWEYTKTYDFGLDFGIFNNKVSGSIDYYKSYTDKLLFDNPLPLTSVFPQVLGNIGKTENNGIEITLNTQIIKTKFIDWNVDWTFAANKNKITYLREGVNEVTHDGNQIWRVGSSSQSYYDYKKEGIYSISDLKSEYEYVQQQQLAGDSIERGKIPMISNQFLPGDLKIMDADKNGIIDEKDKQLYDRVPKYTLGITNNLAIGNWNISVFLMGRVGNTISYDFYSSYKPADLIIENGPNVNAWTPYNTGADFPRYYTNGNAKTYKSTLSYIDGSFFKIKDITLSYSLPKDIINKIHVSNLKVYGTLKNYFTISKIKNYDPEIGGSMNFPLAKQIFVGLNLEF